MRQERELDLLFPGQTSKSSKAASPLSTTFPAVGIHEGESRADSRGEAGGGHGYTIPYFARSLSSMSPKASHGQITVMSVPRPSMPGMSSPNLWTEKTSDKYKLRDTRTLCLCLMLNPSHPFWPGLGALLLKVRMALCLNLGGALFSAGAATSKSAISIS